MASLITIRYQDPTIMTDAAGIFVGDGGTFQLTAEQPLSLQTDPIGSGFGFTGFMVTTTAISFYSPVGGVAFDGSVSIEVEAAKGDPSITANNFSGSATISWITQDGPALESLTPGVALTLRGFVN